MSGTLTVTAVGGAASAVGGTATRVAGLELFGEGTFGVTGDGLLSFGLLPELAIAVLSVRPPLELYAELVSADGHSYRWGSSVPRVEDVVSGVAFASKRYEGFERGSCRLARRIDRDYPDLGLFDSLNFIGYDGSVAYEGRVAQIPRSTPRTVDVEATGWMTHGRDRKFREVYVDRDLAGWREASATRNAALLTSGAVALGSMGAVAPGLSLAIQGKWSQAAGFRAEMWYDAPPGVKLSELYARWNTLANIFTGAGDWILQPWSTDDEVTFTAGTDVLTGAAASGEMSMAGRSADKLMVQLGYLSGPAGEDGFNYDAYLKDIAVYGTHGLERPVGDSPTGLLASDIVRDVCVRFCPRLDPSGIQATSYPIPHVVFAERTDPYDAWLAVNAYHLWELAVWENKKLHYGPADFGDYRWEVRASDPGVEYSLQGDSADRLANYAVVEFRNVLTGKADQVDPSTHPELRDWSAENPLNQHGLEKEFGVSLSSPSDPDGAAEIGRAALAENNQPSAPGTVTVRGHVRDRAGHWHPAWRVRAGDTIAVTGTQFSDRPRMVVEAAWDHSSKTLTIGVDSTLRRLDAYLDRVGTALGAAGLGG